MKKEEEELEQIERYIAQMMSDEEMKSFEDLMENDSDLKTNFEDFSSTIEAIQDYNIKEELKDIHFEVVTKKRRKKSNMFFYVSGLAASLLIIIVSAYFFYFSAPSTSEVYLSYFEPYPELGTSRGESAFSDAYKQYVLGNYENAVKQFSAISDDNEHKESIVFYSSISQMMLGNVTQAIKGLESLPKNNEFEHQSKWYLGLGYLNINNKEVALKYFSKIEEGEYKYQEAKEIIEMFN